MDGTEHLQRHNTMTPESVAWVKVPSDRLNPGLTLESVIRPIQKKPGVFKVLVIDDMYTLRPTLVAPDRWTEEVLRLFLETGTCPGIDKSMTATVSIHMWACELGDGTKVGVTAMGVCASPDEFPKCRRNIFMLNGSSHHPTMSNPITFVPIDFDLLFTPMQALHLIREFGFYGVNNPEFTYKQGGIVELLQDVARLSACIRDRVCGPGTTTASVFQEPPPSPASKPESRSGLEAEAEVKRSNQIIKLLTDATATSDKKALRKIKTKLGRLMSAAEMDALLAKDGSFMAARVAELSRRMSQL